MRSESFLQAGFSLLVSTAFLFAIVIPVLKLGPAVQQMEVFSFVQDYHPIYQLAFWEVLFLCVASWLLCVFFFHNDYWTFDSMGWPMSPVYAVLFFYGANAGTRQELCLVASFLYAIRLNGNYFQLNGWSFVGLEDWRYVLIRKQLEARGIHWSIPGFFLVYISQWLMVWLATIGIYDIMESTHPLNGYDILGFLLIVIGVLLEFVSDQQLMNFVRFDKSKANPVMTTGLWSVSRHPNYIGQGTIWIGISVWTYACGGGYLASLGPLNILALLVFYSIDAMEQRMLDNPSRRKAFQAYQKSTSRILLF